MAAIEEIDPIGQWAAVGAGITVEAVQNAVAEFDLFYPIDLGSNGSATIGGTIATNAGGNRVIRWGMTRQNVLGIEAVLADGTVVPAMNRMLKNNSGYDLKQFFIGSEGTLGVVTRAVLKLLPRPQTQFAALISLPDFSSTIELLRRARRMPHLSAFEVMWSDYYTLVAASAADRPPLAPGQPYYVLVEAMGYDEETDSRQFDLFLAGAFEAGLIVDAVPASSGKQIADLWRIRESSEVIVREMSPFISFDIGVDIRSAEPFIEAVRAALAQSFAAVQTVTFGHLGDNNLHLGVHIGRDTAARETEIERCVYGVLEHFAGAMTAEHGVGRFKREFLPRHVSPGALEMMRWVRACLDSERLLNREVLF
jgi:FAD/FMN-containing dehydrogenase